MITIALSKGSGTPKMKHYSEWIHNEDTTVRIMDLWLPENRENALELVEKVDGIIFTGGADIQPDRYGKEHELGRCEIDPERDAHEFPLFEKAFEKKIPILGICRGHQLINVALGGTLVIDIPSDISSYQAHGYDRNLNQDNQHSITIEPGSILYKITNEFHGIVNSAHHQSIEKPPTNMIISAKSDGDLVAESLEWNDKTLHGFLLGIQWHPERMDYSNPFSQKIIQHFLFESASYNLMFR